MTASHWLEYIAKLNATSQGPRAVSVWCRRRGQGDTGAGARTAGPWRAESGGTPRASQTAMAAVKAASPHHQPCQPTHASTSGPHSKPIAEPSGI
jgi:hypothetical protein